MNPALTRAINMRYENGVESTNKYASIMILK